MHATDADVLNLSLHSLEKLSKFGVNSGLNRFRQDLTPDLTPEFTPTLINIHDQHISYSSLVHNHENHLTCVGYEY